MTDLDEPSRLMEERAAEFPFSEWQCGIEEAANRLKGRVRQCARSAFAHLRKAWHLHGIDDEMSAFRAITAEEEAASALIAALKHRGYPGADRLRPWNHVHKSAFWPLIATVSQFMVETGAPTPQVGLSRKGPPKISIQLNINDLTGAIGDPVWIEPDHPLNFALRSGQATDQKVHLFEEELAKLANDAGKGSIRQYIEREANFRNKLLYASDEGIPRVSFADSLLIERGRRVGILVSLSIIVMQTAEHQAFVTQCLETLLHAIDSVVDINFDYPDEKEFTDRPRVRIHRQEGEPAQISVTRSYELSISWRFGWPRLSPDLLSPQPKVPIA